MGSLYSLCLVLLFGVYCEAQLRKEAYMTVPNLIKAAGYPVEKHRVTTRDGYILQMHRIPAGRRVVRRIDEPIAKGKKVIMIVHGLSGSSGDFVLMGPEKSLSYVLADAGYDVWLANLRGTDYSSHVNLTKNEQKFWEFSFHEHGKYDVPAMIDHVLNVTGMEKIIYLGHSMGSTSFFTMMSMKPEYNDKISFCVAMGAAVYLENVKPIAKLALVTLNVTNIMRERGVWGIHPALIHGAVKNLCTLNQPEIDLCAYFIFSIIGEDREQHDLDMFPIYLHRIQMSPFRSLEHYGKIALTGVFTTFSGGVNGPVKPYNLTNVRVPVTLVYGENDQLTEKSQIMKLAEELKSIGVLEEVRPACSWPKFNHFDFVFAKDVGKLLNKPLVKFIDKLYNKYNAV
ncbi:lipase 1 [Spodoptera frugiperda]|uniref:Lipase n=2 Tax=Spodoptera frugiperda TaxID=7108 RepID=A0A9R0D7K4_SPOFR|nr:lipase 1 [Spodoptera frugiperda]